MSDIYPWHEGLIKSLQEQVHAGRLPHALLFVGDRLNTKQLMVRFIQSQVCEGDGPCLSCSSCRAVEEDSHVAITTLGFGEEKKITVDAIRDLQVSLNLKSQQRLWVMMDAARMNINAANACLKVLEEPNTNVCFLLSTESLTNIAPTIVSRCVKQIVPAPSMDEAHSFLMNHGFDKDEAMTQLGYFDGCPFKVLYYTRKENLGLRERIGQQFFDLLNKDSVAHEIAAQWLKGDVEDALYLVHSLLADLCYLSSGLDRAYLKNQDCMEQLTALSKSLDVKTMFEWLDDWKRTAQELRDTNVNARYALVYFLTKIKEASATV